jgi:hypothetical protein
VVPTGSSRIRPSGPPAEHAELPAHQFERLDRDVGIAWVSGALEQGPQALKLRGRGQLLDRAEFANETPPYPRPRIGVSAAVFPLPGRQIYEIDRRLRPIRL